MNKLTEMRLKGIKLKPGEDEHLLSLHAANALGIPADHVKEIRIIKKSLDARKKENPIFIYSIDVRCLLPAHFNFRKKDIELEASPVEKPFVIVPGNDMLIYPPVIVGAGPAGLFAALMLAKMGYRPLLLEQGRDVRTRILDIEKFWETGSLSETSNAQFGEGGAGTFSDGKLTFRGHSPYSAIVFDEMVGCGAPEEILYWHKPHMGTDVLRKVIPNIRRKITDFGGQVFFETQMQSLITDQDEIRGLKIRDKGDIPARLVLLAPGHSSRGTYEMLVRQKVAVKSKPFAIGLRMEHSQETINRMQYGKTANSKLLPVAEYNFTFQHKDRGVYTFCMCPGGYVINASSEHEHVVTNGMSFSPRGSGRANSAVVAAVNEKDFGIGPLDGMYWQQRLEHEAFKLSGSYKLPSQTLKGFLSARIDETELEQQFKPLSVGIQPANLRNMLPLQIAEPLAEALAYWSAKYSDYDFDSAILSGMETRTSSPVKILRKDNMESVSTIGLYPIGEGAGYAGGIISAAVDGLKAAVSIIERYAPPSVDFPSDMLLK